MDASLKRKIIYAMQHFLHENTMKIFIHDKVSRGSGLDILHDDMEDNERPYSLLL